MYSAHSDGYNSQFKFIQNFHLDNSKKVKNKAREDLHNLPMISKLDIQKDGIISQAV